MSLPEVKDLSPEQQQVVSTWGKGMAVLAGAGSGKTTTLVIKCAELLRRKPEARFAAVSFTERSASDLRAKLSMRMKLDSHWVMTIHGLCATIIREFPREAGFDGEESMLSEPESQLLWERALEALWQDDLAQDIQPAFDHLLERESRDGLAELLKRARELQSFGVLESLARSEDSSSLALHRVACHVLERYDRLKRRRGALDFNDLERGADRALGDPKVRAFMRARFDLILVDEFQDTNPMQASIIKRIVKEDRSNLCVVGDPKQSIYRFRDADVGVFEQFCSELPVNLSLSWNFRSRPGIIDFTNALCSEVFQGAEMSYAPLVPKREHRSDLKPVGRLDVASPADLATWIRSENERGVPLHEMALLLRKIRGNEKWLKALTSAGIPIAVGSGGLFWEDPRVRELVAFLRWWGSPGNRLSGTVFLRAPWVDVSDREIDAWIGSASRSGVSLDQAFLASGHPLAKILAPLKSRVLRPGELLLALLDAGPELEAELGAPLLGLWHRLEELSSRGLDYHAAVAEVARAIEEQRRERDVPPPLNQGQLAVLTLHGAKGLEFNHVILVDFGDRSRAPNAPLLFWDRERGAYLSRRDSNGDRDEDSTQEKAWRELEKKKNLAESMRVFYVALTRARERLVLACPELTKVPKELDSPFVVDSWRAWIDGGGVDIPRLEVPALSANLVPKARAQVLRPQARGRVRHIRPRHSVTEWVTLARCPRQYEWTYVRPKTLPQAVDLAPSVNVSHAELGTRVHRCLETSDFDGLRQLEVEVGRERLASEPLIEWAKTAELMAPANALRDREVWTELAFEIPIAGEVVVGSIDRLIRQGEQWTLVDFKITAKTKSPSALIEAYQTQMELYAAAVSRLEPRVRPEQLQVQLANISAEKLQTITVPVGNLAPESLAQAAAAIVDGKEAVPKPGAACGTCAFVALCDRAVI